MRARQSTLEFTTWGGARAGAGRKPKGGQAGASHAKRPVIAARHPVHVTLRLEPGLESLRKRRIHAFVRRALFEGANRFGMRLVQFSVQSNHLHFVCEVIDEVALGRGIKGICVRMARTLDRLWSRTGRVFADRYHTHVLKTPREVRNALAYVLRNAAHHGIHLAGFDPCSSGAWFDGWRGFVRGAREVMGSPLPIARTWLLAHGRRRHGRIEIALPRGCSTPDDTQESVRQPLT